MNIGDLVQVIPTEKISGYCVIYLKPAFNKIGILVKEELLGLRVKHYIVLVEETLYSIPEVNLRLLC